MTNFLKKFVTHACVCDYDSNSSRMCVAHVCTKTKVEILTFCDF